MGGRGGGRSGGTRGSSGGGLGLGLSYLLRHHAARRGRMRRGNLLLLLRLRGLVLEHAVRLAAAARLILPEARRRRTGLLDFHVAHGAGAIVALTFLPQFAGFLVPECRRFVAVLAVGALLTCRVVEEVAVMQIPR